jgi:AcrR family transcriptional regulator
MSAAAGNAGGTGGSSTRASTAAATGRRQRNARGQGSRLTEDIVTAALNLIDREGTQEAVTLRAVAREIGIAAPSIYAHFADRDAIVMAVVARLFDELSAAIKSGKAGMPDDPVEQLVAGCEMYVLYGLEHPSRYGVLFSGQRDAAVGDYCAPVVIGPGQRPVLEFGAEAFALLADGIEECVRAGLSDSRDVVADGTAVWTALHGTVTLRTALPGFPWPEPVGNFVREMVLRLAKVVTPA